MLYVKKRKTNVKSAISLIFTNKLPMGACYTGVYTFLRFRKKLIRKITIFLWFFKFLKKICCPISRNKKPKQLQPL